ncbi:hypothetical protein BH20VER2_BH20VER2_07880 [soil metagenome]
MFLRLFASAFLLMAALPAASAQEAFRRVLPGYPDAPGNLVPAQSAWIDLRQSAAAHSKPQHVPAWVESVNLVPVPAREGVAARTIFRIRVAHPSGDLQMLLFRLFFDDKPQQRPIVIVWDELGTQVLRSSELGGGIDLPSSDTILLPMIGVSAIDVEVPGDGTHVRGAYLDWMTSRQVAHPLHAEQREIVPEPFAAAAPLRAPEDDTETFGTVTASLAPEVIRMGASVQAGAAFQFGIEALPLAALISFEVSAARVDAPPEIYLNGEPLGPVSLALPDLADPGYRGETERMIDGMRFRYTGWVRAQKLVAGAKLRVGTNDIVVIGGPGTSASAIRATQIQLKYLWDKSDYLLDPK